MILHACCVALFTLAAAPTTTTASIESPPPPETGGAMAPAALPMGSLAMYALIGAPDVGAGYRQGFRGFEFEGRALFNYLELSGIVDATAKVPLVSRNGLIVAPYFGLGLKLDSGARFYDRSNFSSIALRPRVGGALSYLISDLVQFLAVVDVPWAVSINVTGNQVTPTLGAGAEVRLGQSLSLLMLGQAGFDVIKEPLGVAQTRPAWAVRLGLGWRLF